MMVSMIFSAGIPVAIATSRLTINRATKGWTLALMTSNSKITMLAVAMANSNAVVIVNLWNSYLF